MNYCTYLTALLATLASTKLPQDLDNPATPPLADILDSAKQQLLDLVDQFRSADVTPEATLRFERALQQQFRELGRQVLSHTLNSLEPDDVKSLPPHLNFQGSCYTRISAKTNQNVWTSFGQIRLLRCGYRSRCKNGDPTLFPLAQSLGLIEGATPALASHVGSLAAGAGMTQRLILQRLRQDNGIHWGSKKLRQVLSSLAEIMEPQRHESQVQKVLELLEQGRTSKGKHKPVLSVSRDGITLAIRIKKGKVYEVATTATVSVSDRSGKRLGTVYLAYSPEPGQDRMSRELTRLIEDVLRRWERQVPRLCYVSDAGASENGYFKRELAGMKHPRTNKRLGWIRVVDYYHASQRLWTLGECLFGKGQQQRGWVRKMQKWLLKPGGINRVLHSAAAYRSRKGLSGEASKEFEKAYSYLRKRTKYMRYASYREVGVPLGSGVTEAACKTIYTQRLKLSGQLWSKVGAQVVLDLRVLLISDVWDRAFLLALATIRVAKVPDREADREAKRFQTPGNAA
jgi:hypothetical protein